MNNIEKEFVPIQESIELYELCFDEPCLKYKWIDNDKTQWMSNSNLPSGFHTQKCWEGNDDVFTISIPTYSIVFRWFREKYNLHSQIQRIWTGGKIMGFDFGIDSEDGIEDSNTLDTYEEAELACLQKLIEIVKTQKK